MRYTKKDMTQTEELLLGGLNDMQRRAVEHQSGPLLILAGAGSGKTKTLTHRIAWLIRNHDIWPSRILAVTFTNKAAREMRERLAALLGQEQSREFMPWMGTFHSICVRLLRQEGPHIGVPRNFIIYDEDDRQRLVKQAMKTHGMTDKDIKARRVSAAISAAKNAMTSADDFAASAYGPQQEKIAQLYHEYERLRRQAGGLDFDDLLLEVVRLLREHPSVRKQWQQHFAHILVDEYQDTNAAQYEIVKLLAGTQRNICVVGDDWQSIYSWRGADFTNILRFEQDFPGATVIKLEQNYRSTGAILRAAQSVIEQNTQRSEKVLWTDLGEGTPVVLHQVYDETEEANATAEYIRAQVEKGTREYQDFAVLYRTNAQSYQIERSLRQRFIPYQIFGSIRFLDRAVIKDIMAYVRLIYQPSDVVSFTRIVNVPARGIGAKSLEHFLSWHAASGQDLISGLLLAPEITTITSRARRSLHDLGTVLRELQALLASNPAPSHFIETVVKRTGYYELLSSDAAQADDNLEHYSALLGEAKLYADTTTFLEEMALMSSNDSSADGRSVTLMTLHAAKGLEFPVVHMVGLEEGILPHARVHESGKQEDIEEERRLCYVGMTRAREELRISYAHTRLQFGQRSYNMPSRFIDDMKLTPVTEDVADEVYLPDEELFMDDASAFLQAGDRVKTPAFGTGTVQDVDGMAVTVAFDSGQEKKLNVEYARLEKLD